MKRKIYLFLPILLIGMVGAGVAGCAPMVYDSNPRFSNHRLPPPPKPEPGRPGGPYYTHPGNIAPGRPGNPNPGGNPGNTPGHNPGNPNPGRPGNPNNNNHR